MTNKYDQTFLKHFVQLISGPMLLTVVLGFIGHSIYARMPKNESPKRLAAAAARIAPEGAVYAGNTGKAAMAAAQEAAAKAAAGQVAYDGTLDGSVIFGKLCTACHGTGAGGAAAAAELAAGGLDVVVLEEGARHDHRTFSARPRDMTLRLYRDAGQLATIGHYSFSRCGELLNVLLGHFPPPSASPSSLKGKARPVG